LGADAPDDTGVTATASTSVTPNARAPDAAVAAASADVDLKVSEARNTANDGTSIAPPGQSNSVADDASGLIDGDAVADAANAAKLAALAPDPEMDVILKAATGPNHALTWDETATRDYYNGAIGLAWQHTLGDYDPKVLGSAIVTDTDTRKIVDIPVSGNDFYILNDGRGQATFDSRHGPKRYRPMLIVNGRHRYRATRDVYLSSTTVQSLGSALIMGDAQGMLLAFDHYAPQPGDNAHLRLVTEQQYDTHSLTVHRPSIHPVYPQIDATPGGATVADIRASDFTLTGGNMSIANNIAIIPLGAVVPRTAVAGRRALDGAGARAIWLSAHLLLCRTGYLNVGHHLQLANTCAHRTVVRLCRAGEDEHGREGRRTAVLLDVYAVRLQSAV